MSLLDKANDGSIQIVHHTTWGIWMEKAHWQQQMISWHMMRTIQPFTKKQQSNNQLKFKTVIMSLIIQAWQAVKVGGKRKAGVAMCLFLYEWLCDI